MQSVGEYNPSIEKIYTQRMRILEMQVAAAVAKGLSNIGVSSCVSPADEGTNQIPETPSTQEVLQTTDSQNQTPSTLCLPPNSLGPHCVSPFSLPSPAIRGTVPNDLGPAETEINMAAVSLLELSQSASKI